MRKKYILLLIFINVIVIIISLFLLNMNKKQDSELVKNIKYLDTEMDFSTLRLLEFNIQTELILRDKKSFDFFSPDYFYVVMDSIFNEYHFLHYFKTKLFNSKVFFYGNDILQISLNNIFGEHKVAFNADIFYEFQSKKSAIVLWNNNLIYEFSSNNLGLPPKSKVYAHNRAIMIDTNTKVVYTSLSARSLKKIYPNFNGKIININPKQIIIDYDSLPSHLNPVIYNSKFIKINWD